MPALTAKALKPFVDQLGIETADLVARERRPEHQERSARNVDGDPGERFVHRHMHVGIAGDASHVAERLFHGLPERDADVLGGMMVIDVQVAGGLDGQVDQGVAGQEIEHVVEKADPGRDRCRAAAVEIERDRDVGFVGGAFDRSFAHACLPRALYQGIAAAATVGGVATTRDRARPPPARAARRFALCLASA